LSGLVQADLGRMPWRARIRSATGEILGVGVLLGTDRVLTCATPLGGASAGLLVDFVGLPDAPPVPARIAHEPDQGDVALLVLDQSQPAGLGAMLHRNPLHGGRSVHVYGFPGLAEVGVWIPATLGGYGGAAGEWIQLMMDTPVAEGFSGAPVVDDQTGRLIGLVVASPGWMLQTEFIVGRLPQVAEWVRSDAPVVEQLDRLAVKAGSRPSDRSDPLRVSLPKGELRDPIDELLAEPVVPEERRYCARCGMAVGRSAPGRPGRIKGFCPRCASPFDFTPGLQPGDLVDGRYEVLGCLARGGFSWIYLARDRAFSDVYVVLKGLINAAPLGGAESGMLPQLEHPNLVRTLGFADRRDPVTGERTRYLVMEYVAGPSLREIMHRARRLSAEQVAAYGREILSAIEYLHGNGLLYCDMKPGNVIQTGDRVKLIDLGAVRPIGDQHSLIVGTAGYQVGPDEIDQHGMTVRSDIHTVGRTLRDLLEVGHSRVPGLGERSLDRVIARAVAPYDDRFATAAEMSEQLLGVLRELLSLRDGIERPTESSVFAHPTALLDSGLGEVPPASLAECPPSAVAAAALPLLRPDLADLRLAEDWATGLRQLAGGTVDEAPFIRCFDTVPGELAPKLALGYCAEFVGDWGKAEKYYGAVWARDRQQVSAAFGIARVRLSHGDRVGAAQVLDSVPYTSRYYTQARIAAIRVLSARTISMAEPEQLVVAFRRIQDLSGDVGVVDRLTASVLEAMLDILAIGPSARLTDAVGTEAQLRGQLVSCLRRLADSAPPGERKALLARAKHFRRRNWFHQQASAAFEVDVRHNKYLPLGRGWMTVTVRILAQRAAKDVELVVTVAPDQKLSRVIQLAAPVKAERVGGDHVVRTGHWRRHEWREYLLAFDSDQLAEPADRDLPLAAVKVTARRGRTRSTEAQVPIMVHWTDKAELHSPRRTQTVVATRQQELTDVLDAAVAAYDDNDPDLVQTKLSTAVTMAHDLGDEEILRLLQRVVDIVDAETGLVRLREPSPDPEPDLYSTPLVPRVGEYALVSSARTSRASRPTLVRRNRPGGAPAGPLALPRATRRRLPEPAPALQAQVRCESDDPIAPGRSARVSFAVLTAQSLAPLAEPVRLRVLLDALPAAVTPVSRVTVLTIDRRTPRVEFDVVPERNGLLPLVFRVYRDADSQLLLEVRAELPVVPT
jgi:hypothetical protein